MRGARDRDFRAIAVPRAITARAAFSFITGSEGLIWVSVRLPMTQPMATTTPITIAMLPARRGSRRTTVGVVTSSISPFGISAKAGLAGAAI